ncbi:MAG: glycosyltransferase [Gemmatimonadota bacterium]|nr:glycosyltransferase [Gemmatimonadota bacterium]
MSVILTTYRQPEWLEKVLWGYAVQTFADFEIVLGDDGSGEATARVVEELRSETGLEIRHVWQEDRGFRKSTILNKAILASREGYLLFSDGDCVPRRDFVETHVRLAEPDRFLSGGALRLPERTSEAIAIDDVTSGRAFDAGWLSNHGWRAGRRALRLLESRLLAGLLDAITPTSATWNGGNASTWREHVFAVNGLEEEMGYKGQDRALGERLENLGVSGKQARHRAVLLHLEHGREYADPEMRRRNEAIRARIRRTGEVRAQNGLDELEARLPEPGDRLR